MIVCKLVGVNRKLVFHFFVVLSVFVKINTLINHFELEFFTGGPDLNGLMRYVVHELGLVRVEGQVPIFADLRNTLVNCDYTSFRWL